MIFFFLCLVENGVWVADEWSQVSISSLLMNISSYLLLVCLSLQCESRRRVTCVGARSGQQLGEARCSGERPATVSTDQCSGNCQ